MFNESVRPNLYVKPSLNDEVEKWLKNKGNEITLLEPGFTKFPDGKIPKERVQVKPLDIEKYNAEKVTKKAPVKAEKPKLEKKVTKPKTVKKKVKPVKPKKPTKLIVYTERSMIYMHNCQVIREARKNNVKRFEALCTKHGYTDFNMLGNRARCMKCSNEHNQSQYADSKRKALNRELMDVAIKTGQKTFKGICKTHNETDFYITASENTISKLNYKCCKCQQANQLKYEKKIGKAA